MGRMFLFSLSFKRETFHLYLLYNWSLLSCREKTKCFLCAYLDNTLREILISAPRMRLRTENIALPEVSLRATSQQCELIHTGGPQGRPSCCHGAPPSSGPALLRPRPHIHLKCRESNNASSSMLLPEQKQIHLQYKLLIKQNKHMEMFP